MKIPLNIFFFNVSTISTPFSLMLVVELNKTEQTKGEALAFSTLLATCICTRAEV